MTFAHVYNEIQRYTKTGHKIMTKKFTKITLYTLYMIRPFPYHIIYSHVQTTA